MERRVITEEFVTRKVMRLLKDNGWDIISFDLPAMGTGAILHKNGTKGKNKDCIIPDVFAYKNETVLLCESKDFFSKDDVDKLMDVKKGLYDTSISNRLRNLPWSETLVSIAYPESKKTGFEEYKKIDYVFMINKEDYKVKYLNDHKGIK